jgi:hypothetical protein
LDAAAAKSVMLSWVLPFCATPDVSLRALMWVAASCLSQQQPGMWYLRDGKNTMNVAGIVNITGLVKAVLCRIAEPAVRTSMGFELVDYIVK